MAVTSQNEEKKIASALRALERKEQARAFDPYRPESKPTRRQDEVFRDMGIIRYRYLIAGNQAGKSGTAAREVAWILNDNHPYWKRPSVWGQEPLLIIIAGQDLTMMETELWNKKVKPFLHGSKWEEKRQGNVLKRVLNSETGDQVVFVSHADGSESNRKHMQGYTAHYVWLDEMPSSHIILEELQLRVQSKRGSFLATFTPKFRNDRIRKIIDASEPPVAKVYRMSKFDNPIFADSYAEEMSRLQGFTDSEKRTILYGDWSTGDNSVYQFNYEMMTLSALPDHYSPAWRHVEAVDPAMRSKFGYSLWAEDPFTGTWILVRDNYIVDQLAPTDMVREVVKLSGGYNLIRRISDPHEPWYLGEAQKVGINYVTPHDKRGRKDDMIKNLQANLSSGKIKIGRWCGNFLDEIQRCQWSENSERIINSSTFHILDCAQYFCDMMPPFDAVNANIPWHTDIRMRNAARKRSMTRARIGRGTRSRGIRGWGVDGFYKHNRKVGTR